MQMPSCCFERSIIQETINVDIVQHPILPNFQVRGGKPSLPPALAEGTQIIFVAATVSSKMLTKIQSLVPVSPVGEGKGVSDNVNESE